MQNMAECGKKPLETKKSMVWCWNRIRKMKKLPKNELSDCAFREKIRVPVYTFMTMVCRLSCPYSAKRKRFVFLFASTVFSEWHCALAPLRMFRCGKRGRLSFQDCKLPCCNCRICVWYALSHTPLMCHSCKEPLSLPEWSGRLHRTNPTTRLRSSTHRLYLSA